jgi:hypothetical protein
MNATPNCRRGHALLPGNAAGGVIMGTFVGASLSGGVVFVNLVVSAALTGNLDAGLGGGLVLGVLFFLFSLPVWAGGLILVGLPGWIALHALGWRSRRAGAAFGAVATFVVSWVLVMALNAPDTSQPWIPLAIAGVLALIGTVVGWVMMATGYDEKEGAR